MQIQLISAALFAAAVAISSPTKAEAVRAQATLAAPAASPGVVEIDGVQWRCEGAACAGAGERRAGLDSLMKECRKVAAALGPLASYESRGREMSAGNLKACNRAAGPAGQLRAAN